MDDDRATARPSAASRPSTTPTTAPSSAYARRRTVGSRRRPGRGGRDLHHRLAAPRRGARGRGGPALAVRGGPPGAGQPAAGQPAARRTCRRRLRGQQAGTGGRGEPRWSPRDERRTVLAALARLRDSDQEILRLAVWEELPHREIAGVVGCSESSVAVRLHRARTRLGREIGKEERRVGQEDPEGPGRRAEGLEQ